MPLLDIRTLSFLAVVSNLLLWLGLLLLQRLSQRNPSLRLWTQGTATSCAALFLFVLRGLVPDLFSVVGGNMLLILGAVLLYLGNRRFQGVTDWSTWYWYLAAVTVAIAAALSYFTYWMPSLPARIAVFSLTASFVSFASGRALLLAGDSRDRMVRWFLAAGYLTLAVFLAMRAVITLYAVPLETEFLALTDPMQTLSFVLAIGLNIALGIGLPLLVLGGTQRELAESEDRYGALFENAKAVMLLVDPETGGIIEGNRAAQRFYGYDNVQLGQMRISDINTLPEEDVRAEMQRASKEQRDCFYFEHRLAGGEVRQVEVYSGPFQYGGKTVLYSIVHDVTERKLAEQRIQRLLAEQKAMLESDLIGIVRVKERIMIWANPAFEKMLGYAPGELVGRPTRQTYPSDEAYEAFGAACYPVLAAGKIFRTQSQHLRKDGERIWMDISGAILDHESGESLWAFVDITERKGIETALIAARKTADAANRAKSEFLTNMSHEIRTPLNGVIGNAQLLEMSDMDAEQKEYLSAIMISGSNLLSLVNDILDLSKIEAEKVVLEQADFSLRGCVNNVIRTQRSRIANKGLTLSVRIPNEVTDALIGDELRVKQILLNLLGNAIKFTKEGGITLAAELKEQSGGVALIEISVSDTGIGIPQAVAADIFKPFVQADSSITRRYGGSGLGLAICRRLTELMGGSIAVESAEGAGSTFRVLLPFSVVGAVVPEQGAEPGASEALWSGPALSILLAEDNEISQRVGAALLRKMGHRVTIAENGKEALAALDQARFDLVLMDIQMPVMGGSEALAARREQERNSGARLPVIALTAYALKGDREKYLALGFDGYVSKPVEAKKLTAEMRRALKLHPAESPA